MSADALAKLTQAIFELKVQIEHMSERQDEMLDDVKKNPAKYLRAWFEAKKK